MNAARFFAVAALLTLGLSLFLAHGDETLASAPGQTGIGATPTASPGVIGPIVGKPVAPASFDGDVRSLPQLTMQEQSREAPRPFRRAPRSTTRPQVSTPTQDPVLQTWTGTQRTPFPLSNFEGLGFSWGFVYPPDPNGDVGPNHYIQAVNKSIGIFSKTGAQLAALTFNTLFSSGLYPCTVLNQGDPIALYDQISGHWIVADFAFSTNFLGNPTGPFYECIAVSKTTDPVLGGWWLYTFEADSQVLNDYPKLGVWSDGIYMSANMFDTNGVLQSARLWAFNRNDMISGAALRSFSFSVIGGYSTLLPGNLRGSLPPPGTPEFFLSVDDTTSTLHLWKFTIVRWSPHIVASLYGPTNLAVASFSMPCMIASIFPCVPEQGGERVDGLGDRLMMQLQYRNLNGVESLWANHTVAASMDVGYPTGIRWYEIRDPNGTPTVYQQGTYQPDSNYRWMGSLAVDDYGNMALGYSVSNENMYPAIRYTGRFKTDLLGTLPVIESTLIQGTGSQDGGFNRWGDYSAMTLDPDGCTFWYTNEYYSTTGGSWKTRIGSFQLYHCSGTLRYFFPLMMR